MGGGGGLPIASLSCHQRALKMARIMPAGDEFFDSDDDGFEFGDEYDTSYNKPINSHPNTREEIKPKVLAF